jgi:hypothetical protein
MTFGSDWGWGADAQEARSIFDAYVDREGNLVDRSVIANPFPKAGHLAQPANGSRYPGTLLHPLGISAVVGAEPSRMIR